MSVEKKKTDRKKTSRLTLAQRECLVRAIQNHCRDGYGRFDSMLSAAKHFSAMFEPGFEVTASNMRNAIKVGPGLEIIRIVRRQRRSDAPPRPGFEEPELEELPRLVAGVTRAPRIAAAAMTLAERVTAMESFDLMARMFDLGQRVQRLEASAHNLFQDEVAAIQETLECLQGDQKTLFDRLNQLAPLYLSEDTEAEPKTFDYSAPKQGTNEAFGNGIEL